VSAQIKLIGSRRFDWIEAGKHVYTDTSWSVLAPGPRDRTAWIVQDRLLLTSDKPRGDPRRRARAFQAATGDGELAPDGLPRQPQDPLRLTRHGAGLDELARLRGSARRRPRGLPSSDVFPPPGSAYGGRQRRRREVADITHEKGNVSAAAPTKALSLVSRFPHVDGDSRVGHSQCRERCVFAAAAQWHHARLTAIESDHDALLELFELALTWHELDYSERQVIPPVQWMAFVANHRWVDPDRIERIFRIATDIVMATERAARQRPGVSERWPVSPTMGH
jgi:hypothetical protein